MTQIPPPPMPPKGGMPKWLIILLVILLILMLGCCGGITACYFAARKLKDVGVGMIDEAAKKSGMQIDFAGKGLAMPKRMPSDVTIYPGMKIVMAIEPPDETGSVATLSGGKDAPQKVMDYYEKALTDAGWTAGAASSGGDTLNQEFKKGNETVQVTTSGKAGDTTAVISYSKEEKAKPEEGAKNEEPAKPEDGAAAPRTGSRTETPAETAAPSLSPGVRMPTGFPTDIPMYKGAQPVHTAWDRAKGEGMIMLQTTDEPAKVSSYYEKALNDGGWKIENNMEMNGGSIIIAGKDGRKLNITTMPEDKLTNVSIMQQKE